MQERLEKSWEAAFDKHPWLEGLNSGDCDDAFCCPHAEYDIDWLVLSEVQGLLFLLTGNSQVKVLTRALIYDVAKNTT